MRGSASARGYTSYWSKVFVPWFKQLLASLGIPPACGYSLPGGPDMRPFSQCRAEGRINVEHLHVDHQPPLETWERTNQQAVCDQRRVGLLCRACHSRKTLNEQRSAP